jgi:PII-like signaling protein
MVQRGPAKKLIVYVDEKDKAGRKPVYEAVLDVLYRNGIVGASVFRGIEGYGADGVFHTSKMLELSGDMPVKVEAVDSEEKIDAVLPEICGIVEKGLVEVSDTTIVSCGVE